MFRYIRKNKICLVAWRGLWVWLGSNKDSILFFFFFFSSNEIFFIECIDILISLFRGKNYWK